MEEEHQDDELPQSSVEAETCLFSDIYQYIQKGE